MASTETVRDLRIKIEISGTVDGSDGTSQRVLFSVDQALSDGGGNNQVDWVWQDNSRAVATETIDLDALTNFQGETPTVSTVKLLAVKVLGSTTTDRLVIGGGDWAGTGMLLEDTTDKLRVHGAGGFVIAYSPVGYTVTASTGDGLATAAGAGTPNAQWLIAGDSS